MAATQFGTNDAGTVKRWATALIRESIYNSLIARFTGRDQNALLYRKDDLVRFPGDRIRVSLRPKISGVPIQGFNQLEGKEKALQFYYDNVVVNHVRQATRSERPLTEQRSGHNMRAEMFETLRDYWTDYHDQAFFYHLCGYQLKTDTAETANNAPTTADADHILQPNGGNEEDLSNSSDNKLSANLIDRVVEVLRSADPRRRPLQMRGMQPMFAGFIHGYQTRDLRADTGAGGWADLQKAAIQGGQVSGNPMFTGALAMHNGVVLHESPRVTFGVNDSAESTLTSVRRAAFGGAQALCISWAMDSNGYQDYGWVEETFDYEKELGVASGFLYGIKKMVYNGSDYNTHVLPTFATNTD